ncbi:MAG: MBOAT family protein [Bacteroidales bacterium]|nr:MBOAT family protein [Bacteroidales bacterium]
MLFNSLVFLIFCSLFLALLPVINRQKNNFRWSYFIIASFIFYGWWDWRFLFLIIGSGLIDFFSGRLIYKYPRKGIFFLILSLIGNIGSLAAFKYSLFLSKNTELLLNNLGIEANIQGQIPEFMYILPVGISFYTFQSMSYTIDIYRGRLKPTRNVLHFFTYLSMFPQLVAGPIVRAKELLPQIIKVKKVSKQENWNGFHLILVGYFKKVVLADNIAPLVNYAFSDANTSDSTLYWWVVMLGFAFQIYFDFSGYSDIARGIAKWMGIHFKMNFNHPYISTSLREFWTRWHISLSTWFRDYAYIPMGGSKKGKLRSHLNIWVTMVVSGLWHGASWTFIVWGALHAFYLSLERLIKPNRVLNKIKAGRWIAATLVMIQVLIAWVFFRAETFEQAFSVIKNMLWINTSVNFNEIDSFNTGLFYIIIGVLIELYFFLGLKRKKIFTKKIQQKIQIIQFIILIIAIVFLRGEGAQFIYFQF